VRKRALRYIFPRTLYVGLGLGLSWGVRVRIGVRIR